MKKILLAITSLVLTATLSASGSHINLYGGSSSQINSESGYTFGTGYDFIFTKPKATAIEIGLGLDVLYNSVKNDHSYNGDLSLLIGFKKNSFAVRTGVGYGIGSGTISQKDFTQSGLVYSAGAEYDFTNRIGIGLKYKVQDFDMEFTNTTQNGKTKNVLMYFYFRK